MAQRRKTTIGRNPLDALQDVPERRQGAARDAADDTGDVSRRVFEAWVAGTEETLRATFDAQNAALAAGLSIMDATAASQRGLIEDRFAAAAREHGIRERGDEHDPDTEGHNHRDGLQSVDPVLRGRDRRWQGGVRPASLTWRNPVDIVRVRARSL